MREMLSRVTPFRQIARLYDSVLSISNSLVALAEALKPQKKDVDLYQRFDMRLLLDKSSLVDRNIIENGSWEAEQTNFFMGLMGKFVGQKNSVFIDIGAYWGLYSLLALRYGVDTIYAFEPDRHNFAQLQAQIFLNGASGHIRPINKAVSISAATVRFWDSRTHPSGNRAGVGIVDKHFALPTYDVEAVSIDEHLQLEDATIGIKLDVEGHEPEALRGMTQTLKKNRVIMQIEVFDCNCDRILPLIETLGIREIKRISPDRYYTNMTVEQLGI
jgi:FkbM family methyltransferase